MLKFNFIIIILFVVSSSLAQKNGDSLIYTIPQPELKWGLPNDILFSHDNKYFLVAYDFNPTHLYLFELNNFRKIKKFRIRGHIYLSFSFFYSDNTEIYIDIGKRINIGKEKTQYYLFDLKTGKRKKIKCEDGPKGCDYPIDTNPYRNEILREYLTFDNSLLFKIENGRVNIYKIKAD